MKEWKEGNSGPLSGKVEYFKGRGARSKPKRNSEFEVVKEKEGLCVIDNPVYQSIIIDAFTPSINGVEDKYLPEYVGDFTYYLSPLD